MGQGDQGMEPQVGNFSDDFGGVTTRVSVFGGHDHLGGFFADFLQKGIGALVEQPRHIAGRSVSAMRGLATLDNGG